MKKTLTLAAVLLFALCALAGTAMAQEIVGNYTVGMLEDAAMHSLVVHTDDGRSYNFGMDDDTAVDAPEGLLIGERVLIEYDGDAEDSPVATGVTVLSSITGTVVDATMHGVTIETHDGHSYHFNEDDDTQTIASKGVTIGAPLEIAYQGAMAFAVEDQDVKVWEVFVGQKVTGEIEHIEDDTLDIEVNGRSLSFSTDNVDIEDAHDFKKGNTATVKFYGALDLDASVQQVRVAGIAAHAKPAAPAPTEAPAHHSLEGTVEDASMHTITVRTAKHNLYTFEKRDSTKIKGKVGIGVGDTVKVYYTGSLNSRKDVQPVKVTEIDVVKHKEHEQHESHAEEAIMGVVKDATMHTVTIKANQRKYTFELHDSTEIDMPDGLYVGATIKVYYKGTLHKTKKVQPVKVTRIVDKDD